MRNLKKVLALALATVMLLGMMAMASAKEYVDDAAIDAKYDAAIDIMFEIGALEGNADGTFNPKGNLTRAQAAAIAARVAMKRENADHVTAVVDPFTDVSAAAWYARYVVAAENLGLVAGMGDGTYAPNGTLKGIEFAKMLLCMLGYDAATQGYLGGGWTFYIEKDARAAGLLANLADLNLGAAITREQAAQMAFNALKANPVSYKDQTSEYNKETGKVETYGGTLVVDETTTFGEANYKLTEGTKTVDGYAYTTWKIDGTEKAAAPNYTVQIATANELTKGALYAKVGKATESVAVKVYLNGVDTEADLTVTKADYMDKTTAAIEGIEGTEIQVIKNGTVPTIMITYTQIATVEKVNAAEGETKRNIDLKTTDGFEIKGYETEAFAEKDVLKIVYNGTKVIAAAKVAAADAVHGTVTKVDTKAGTVYVDGTAIKMGATLDVTVGVPQTIYMNAGYGIASVVDPEAVPAAPVLGDYVIVINQATAAFNEPEEAEGTFGSALEEAEEVTPLYKTQVVYMDGTVKTIDAVAFTGEFYAVYELTTDEDGNTDFEVAAAYDAETNNEGCFVVGATEAFDGSKFYAVSEDKYYVTAGTKVLTIDYTAVADGGVSDNSTIVEDVAYGFYAKAAKVEAIPAEADEADYTYVYTYNKTADKFELAVAVTFVDADAEVEPEDVVYYVDAELLGTIYDAEAKKNYDQYAIYDLTTGEQTIAKVAEGTEVGADGFKYVTETKGVYAFAEIGEEDEVELPVVVEAASKAITVYNDMLTVTGEGGFEDYEVGAAKVVDLTGNGIDTVAKLVAKSAAEKAVSFFFVEDTDEDTVNTIALIVVTAVA